MFYCKKCGFEFEKPQTIYEQHGLNQPPFEEVKICPNCHSKSFYEKKITHCRCCGARMLNSYSIYCSPRCREKGEKLYELERKRKRMREESPISEIIKRVKKYNKDNNTNYSYGQYVALILPREKVKKKCKNSKKNI